MKNSTKGFVAGAAGVGLLLGASTFALWSDSDSASGGTITSGNLNVNVHDNPQWEDVSGNDSTPINLSDFRIVPGDTLQGRYFLDVELEGDNMEAGLSLENSTLDEAIANGLDVRYDLRQASTGEQIANGGDDGAQFSLTPETIPAGVATSNDANYEVVVTVEFPAENDNLDLTQTTTALGEAKLELVQLRGESLDSDS